MLGAKGDGVTNDHAAITSAMEYLNGAGTVRLNPRKTYVVDSNLTIPKGVTLNGGYTHPTFPGWNPLISWSLLGGIALNAAASIILLGGAGLANCFIKRKGMALPAADASAFAGTAVRFASRQDAQVAKDLFIVGFATAIIVNDDRGGVTPQTSRYTIERIWFDCTAGIDVDTSYDTARIRDVHGWPFATIETYSAGGSSNPALIMRAGSGFKVRGAADDLQIDGVLMYGFATNFDFASTGAINIGRIWSDHPANQAGTRGISFGNNVTGLSIANASVWGAETCVVAEMASTEHVKIGTLHTQMCATGIALTSGTLLVGQHYCKTATRAISFGSTNARVKIGQAYYEAITAEPFALPASFNYLNAAIQQLFWDGAAGAVLFGVDRGAVAGIASSDPLNLPPAGDFVVVTGTTGFGQLTGGYAGRQVTLLFQAALTVFNGSGSANSMRLAGNANFTAAANSTLTLRHTGSNWVEVCRAA